MPKDSMDDLREALEVMGYKPRTKGDGSTVLYLEVLVERPVYLLEFEDVPPGTFIHAARLWLDRRHLNYVVKIDGDFVILKKNS